MIHKEGKKIIWIVFPILFIINGIGIIVIDTPLYLYTLITISVSLLTIILQFFRNPKRTVTFNDNCVYSPADGKVVVIEKTNEEEYFKDERIQISIFMSLWNVHVNRFPISGTIRYFKYHEGSYIVARNPKSSHENEHTSVVVEDVKNRAVFFKQIAGIVARRIVFYKALNEWVKQGEQCGFIKFGSRVDIFVPIDAHINVKIGDRVQAGISILAEF
jgi:phosphatidylserine decarboxylase